MPIQDGGRDTRCGKRNAVAVFIFIRVRISRKNYKLPTPVGKDSPMQSTICFAARVKSGSSPRGVWAFRLRWVNSVYRGANKAVSTILRCPHGNDYCGRAPSRTVVLMRWPEGRAAPRSQRARSQSTLSSATLKCSGSVVGKVGAVKVFIDILRLYYSNILQERIRCNIVANR